MAGRTGYRAGGHANWGAFAALKQDGSITAWGSSEYGSTGAPTDTGYTAIFSTATKGSWPTATSAIFAALKQDGSITAWGSSDYNNDYGSGDSGSGDASPPPVPPPVPPSPPPNNARLGTFRQCADLSAVYPGRTSLGPGSAGQPLSFTVAECAAEVAKASVANGGECGNTFHFLNDQYGPGNYPRCLPPWRRRRGQPVLRPLPDSGLWTLAAAVTAPGAAQAVAALARPTLAVAAAAFTMATV